MKERVTINGQTFVVLRKRVPTAKLAQRQAKTTKGLLWGHNPMGGYWVLQPVDPRTGL